MKAGMHGRALLRFLLLALFACLLLIDLYYSVSRAFGG